MKVHTNGAHPNFRWSKPYKITLAMGHQSIKVGYLLVLDGTKEYQLDGLRQCRCMSYL